MFVACWTAPGCKGAWILILDLRSTNIRWFEGEGVPQNRLMRADDSCRAENAGVEMCPLKPLCCLHAKCNFRVVCEPEMVRQRIYVCFFALGCSNLARKSLRKNEVMRIAVKKGTPPINRRGTTT